jgi:hypothetical protein
VPPRKGKTIKDYPIGSYEGAIENARVRAREENRHIYVLRYLNRDRTYTASVCERFATEPTLCYGHAEKKGRSVVWMPAGITTMDDVRAWLRSLTPHDEDPRRWRTDEEGDVA